MTIVPTPSEADRLAALDRYDVLDTPREESFDRITRLVRRVFDVPMTTVTLIDGHRQWFKSRQGMRSSETERGPALCDHVVRLAEPVIVPDTLLDPRFAENPFVVGEPRLRFYAGAPLHTPDGHVIGTLCAMDTRPRAFSDADRATLIDLARIVMDELELRTLATTDSLTGSMSRRAFREEGGRAVGLALRHQHELSAIAVDLDRFKSINDRYGHAVGDAVLAGTVEALRGMLRKTDLIGRLGGEEFAALLPQTGRKAALDVAEKLRAAVAARTFDVPGGGRLSVTASFGVATLDRSVPDLDALLKNADTALYAAKAAGRDRVMAWQVAEAERPTIRRRVLKAGRIAFNNRRSSIDCTVRSLSEEGAGLDVFTAAGVPRSFDLAIDSDGFLKPCHIVSQAEKHIEVRFD